MRALVAEWRRVGGSAAAFAAKHGVSAVKFGYWRRRAAGGRGAAKAEPIDFRAVRLVGAESASAAAPVEISFATGERVLIQECASVEILGRVVSTLRARC
jgi:hypothetical protein